MKKTFFLSILITAFFFNAYGESSDPMTDEFSIDFPGKGMITDQVEYDGIELSNFAFSNGKKYAVFHSGDEILGQVDFKINKKDLSLFRIHYFIIGLFPNGPQSCLVKSYGLRDSQGTARFSLIAPKDKGVYQIRFSHGTGVSCKQAKKAWWDKHIHPAKTMMGIIVVK